MSTQRDHLDAETVAAWMDGGLDAVSLAAAEAHASNCERCQALLATVSKTLPIAEGDVAPGFSRGLFARWRLWLAPVAATAAAVTIWMVVPQEQAQQKVATAPAAEMAAPPVAAPPVAGARARDEAPPMAQAAQPKADADQQFNELKRQAQKPESAKEKLGAASANVADATAPRDRRDVKAEEERAARLEAAPTPAPARVAAAPAAPPPAAAAPAEKGALAESVTITQLRKQAGPLQILSPDPRFRWRATADGIELSQDGGRTWLTVRLPQGEVVTAGASPAPLVCWMVGRRGLVLVATDGTDFTQIPFPEPVDLTAVSSPELRIAVVTTADGRIFRTENAGRTWIRQ